MKFSEFAQALSPFYMGEMTQWNFVKELLLQITNNKEMVLKHRSKGKLIERTDKTFTSYYTGKRSIKPIAKKIHNDLQQDKFIDFLRSKEFNNNDKEELCKIFRKHFPNMSINNNNIFSIITEIFIDIINKSCESTNKIETPSIDDKTISIKNTDLYSTQQDIDIKSLINKLNETINSLINIGHRIASRQSSIPLNDIVAKSIPLPIPPKLESKLDEEYDELLLLYDEIEDYNINNNNEFLEKVLTLLYEITKESFIETKESFIITSLKNYPIYDLLSLIQKYQRN